MYFWKYLHTFRSDFHCLYMLITFFITHYMLFKCVSWSSPSSFLLNVPSSLQSWSVVVFCFVFIVFKVSVDAVLLFLPTRNNDCNSQADTPGLTSECLFFHGDTSFSLQLSNPLCTAFASVPFLKARLLHPPDSRTDTPLCSEDRAMTTRELQEPESHAVAEPELRRSL